MKMENQNNIIVRYIPEFIIVETRIISARQQYPPTIVNTASQNNSTVKTISTESVIKETHSVQNPQFQTHRLTVSETKQTTEDLITIAKDEDYDEDEIYLDTEYIKSSPEYEYFEDLTTASLIVDRIDEIICEKSDGSAKKLPPIITTIASIKSPASVICSPSKKRPSKTRPTKQSKQSICAPPGLFICDACGKTFTKRTVLTSHIKRHDPSRWPQCKICLKKFPDGLSRHMRTHTGERPYACTQCPAMYRQIAALREHSTIHEPTTLYKCLYCDKSYNRKNSWRLHQRSHYVSNKKSSSALNVSYCCTHCGVTATSSGNLKKHMLFVHSEERPFKCDICNLLYKTKQRLAEHTRTHTGERPYKCTVCGKSFSASSGLRGHAKIHIGIKQHQCDVCKKAFLTRTHLKKHFRLHSGEKPFACDVCGKRFSDNGNRKGHMKTHYKAKGAAATVIK